MSVVSVIIIACCLRSGRKHHSFLNQGMVVICLFTIFPTLVYVLNVVKVNCMFEWQVDCGDVVRLLSEIGGIKKEIGKGIVMGLVGSKFSRKIIPKGWRSVKLTSYTFGGSA